jgi:hypothetical protein
MLLSEVLPAFNVRKRRTIELEAPSESRGLLELEGFQRLREEPGTELVLGGVGKPWSPRGGLVCGADPRTFREPGYALMVVNIAYDGATLSTETRVLCTDARSRALFRLYWLVVGPFSRLVRDDWLRAIVRRAEAPEGARTDGRVP